MPTRGDATARHARQSDQRFDAQDNRADQDRHTGQDHDHAIDTNHARATKPKEASKADAKEAAAIKKQLDEARAALRTLKADKAIEALDLALLEATADDSNAAIERMKKVVEANQKFWESAVAGAQSLKAADELKSGDELLATVTEVDENKAMVKFEERNQPLLFKSPDKWPAKLLVACVEKALSKGSEAANVAIAAYLMIDPKGDRDQAKQLLEAAGAAGSATARRVERWREVAFTARSTFHGPYNRHDTHKALSITGLISRARGKLAASNGLQFLEAALRARKACKVVSRPLLGTTMLGIGIDTLVTFNPITVTPHTPIDEVVRLMSQHGSTTCP